MAYFVDTNIFLRFLVGDVEEQYLQCEKLFEKAKKGKIKLNTSNLVLFELIWTLDSYYEEPKKKIIEKVHSLLKLPNLEVEDKNIFVEALVLWEKKNIEFNDAFNFIWARNKENSAIFSYDKHFDKLDLSRKEP